MHSSVCRVRIDAVARACCVARDCAVEEADRSAGHSCVHTASTISSAVATDGTRFKQYVATINIDTASISSLIVVDVAAVKMDFATCYFDAPSIPIINAVAIDVAGLKVDRASSNIDTTATSV